jgi:hypothetical protein
MENIAYYRAELDYRREQMRHDRTPLWRWRRTESVTAPKNRAR